jgi:hypothetical protein
VIGIGIRRRLCKAGDQVCVLLADEDNVEALCQVLRVRDNESGPRGGFHFIIIEVLRANGSTGDDAVTAR